jgi:hypothetical protein
VIRNFSRNMLLLASKSQRLGVSGRVRPPEACFQDEFYRCAWAVLGTVEGISSEWSNDGHGRVDFYLPTPRWAFELLRDGDRLEQHCLRFCENGSYNAWIKKNEVKDWLILDCRHSIPQTTCKISSSDQLHTDN